MITNKDSNPLLAIEEEGSESDAIFTWCRSQGFRWVPEGADWCNGAFLIRGAPEGEREYWLSPCDDGGEWQAFWSVEDVKAGERVYSEDGVSIYTLAKLKAHLLEI